MRAFYNEIDPFAADWLRRLAADGCISDGVVDQRSIVDLTPADLAGHGRVHFFAGIGGWDLALQLAGWPEDLPIWTGSCPCQPFSAAGKQRGTSDERHLWPEMFRLVRECRPSVIIGEQVASAAALAWLDAVFADLEGAGYACGAVDLCAASVGAPHIRQRLYWVAERVADGHGERCDGPRGGGGAGRLADGDREGRGLVGGRGLRAERDAPRGNDLDGRGEALRVGDPGGARGGRDAGALPCAEGGGAGPGSAARSVADEPVASGWAGDDGAEQPSAERAGGGGPWSDAQWLPCLDGRLRPAQPGAFPLAHVLPRGMGRLGPRERGLAEVAGLDGASLRAAKANRTGRLRGYGNAVVPEIAAEFVRAYLDIRR